MAQQDGEQALLLSNVGGWVLSRQGTGLVMYALLVEALVTGLSLITECAYNELTVLIGLAFYGKVLVGCWGIHRTSLNYHYHYRSDRPLDKPQSISYNMVLLKLRKVTFHIFVSSYPVTS